MVGNIIFNILTISGMVFNIGTSKGQEPNITIDQAPIVETLKAKHTYTFDIENFALDNQANTPTENDILIIRVSSAINAPEYINATLSQCSASSIKCVVTIIVVPSAERS